VFALPLSQALPAKTIPDDDRNQAQERCRFDEHFATVEQVRMAVLEVRVSQDAVQEEQHRSGKDEIVQASPQRTAEAGAEQRREEHEQQQIERRGAREVEFWLKRRLDREQDVEQPEMGIIEEEQDRGMCQRECDSNVGGPLVEREKIHPSMRPEFQGAVPQGHQHAKPKIDGSCAYSPQTEIGAYVKDAEVQAQVDSMVGWINSENLFVGMRSCWMQDAL